MKQLILFQEKTLVPIVILAGALLLALFILSNASWQAMSVLIAGALVAGLLATHFEWGFWVMLLIRPSLDLLNQTSVLTLGPISFNPAELVGLLLTMATLLFLTTQKNYLKYLPGRLPVVGLILSALLSLGYSIALGNSLSEFTKLLNIFLIYAVVFSLALRHDHHRGYLFVLLGSALLPMMLGLWQYLTGTGLTIDGVANRLFGTFVHPNSLAYFLLIVANLCLLLAKIEIPKKKLWLIILVLSLFLILFTYTRGAWIGLAISLTIWGTLSYRKAFAFLTASLALGVIASVLVILPLLQSRGIGLENTQLYQRIFTTQVQDSSVQSRLQIWNETAEKIFERPLLGTGTGTFLAVRTTQINSAFTPLLEAHNDYLRLAVEQGLPGSLLYLILWIALSRLAAKRLTRPPLSNKPWATALLSLVLTFGLVSVIDNLLAFTAVMWLLWASIAIILARLIKLSYAYR